MSSLMVKKALALFDEEDESGKGNTKKKQKQSGSESTNKWGAARKRKREQQKVTHLKQQEQKKIKSVVDEYRKKQKGSNLDRNLQQIQKLSKAGVTKAKISAAILDHHKGKLAKNRKIETKTEEETVFTDRDFDDFEEEYDFFS